MNYESYSKLFKELKNGIEILVSEAVFELQIKRVKMCFWTKNSRTASPTLILVVFLSSLDNLL